MPRVVRPAVDTPAAMRDAIAVLGTELRAHLVKYFLEQPGLQKDAAAALGVTRKTISENVALLVQAGVLVQRQAADRRSTVYSVDQERLAQLLRAASDFFFPPSAD